MKKVSLVLFLMMFLFAACERRTGDQYSTNDTTHVGPGQSNSIGQDTTGNHGNDFAMEAASGGMMEVTLGKLAQQMAKSADVKKFGSRMVTDHSKAGDELKQIAKKNNITISDSMMDKHRDMVNELSGLKGGDFDKKYMDMMVDDHQEDVDKFEQESKDDPNSPVGMWAAKTLPVLREHLSMAKQINDKLK